MGKITEADVMREFAYHKYILPAQERGDTRVSFSAKELHVQMGIKKSNYPNLIGALCRNIMIKRYGVKAIHREPPTDGPNVIISYEL